jgi:hypothetical protein
MAALNPAVHADGDEARAGVATEHATQTQEHKQADPTPLPRPRAVVAALLTADDVANAVFTLAALRDACGVCRGHHFLGWMRDLAALLAPLFGLLGWARHQARIAGSSVLEVTPAAPASSSPAFGGFGGAGIRVAFDDVFNNESGHEPIVCDFFAALPALGVRVSDAVTANAPALATFTYPRLERGRRALLPLAHPLRVVCDIVQLYDAIAPLLLVALLAAPSSTINAASDRAAARQQQQERPCHVALAVAREVLGHGWTVEALTSRVALPVALPLLKTLAAARSCGGGATVGALDSVDTTTWPTEVLALLRRTDVLLARGNVAAARSLVDPVAAASRAAALTLSNDLAKLITTTAAGGGGSGGAQISSSTHTGNSPLCEQQLELALRVLQSSRPALLPPGTDPAEAPRTVLPALARLTLALPLGRGMMTLCSHGAGMERIPVPPMTVLGVTSEGVTVAPAATGEGALHPGDRHWPNVHNAAAEAGRFLPLPAADAASDPPAVVSREWIVLQARNEAHRAGFLVAIGALGHFRALQVTDLYATLTSVSLNDPHRDHVTMSVLLGLGLSFRGQRTDEAYRCIGVHWRPLTPANQDVEVSADVQCAASVALGLLYAGSRRRFFAEGFLNDIARAPSDEYCRGRKVYSLCAAVGLGLVTLGAGRDHGLGTLDVESHLIAMLDGGRRPRSSSIGGTAPHDGLFNTASSFNASDGGGAPGGGMMFEPASIMDGPPCSTVAEGVHFNPHVSGAPACVALGLMYLGTCDEVMAERVALPQSLPKLEAVSPDLALLRQACAVLIRWPDAAGPTIASHFKSPLLATVAPRLARSQTLRETDAQAQYHALLLGFSLAGCCLGLGLRFAGTQDAAARAMLLTELRGFATGQIGTSGVAQCILHRKALAFEPCVSACATALAMVVAGSGDVEVTKLLRSLLQRPGLTHGAYMALGASLGLVHLAEGRCTLSNSVDHVACLLIAFYPRWPRNMMDGSDHLQCLRYLYMAAVTPRWATAIDADTGAVVPLTATFTVARQHVGGGTAMTAANRRRGGPDSDRGTTTVTVRLPCLLPAGLEHATHITTAHDGSGYYPLHTRIDPAAPASARLKVAVKRLPVEAICRGPAVVVAANSFDGAVPTPLVRFGDGMLSDFLALMRYRQARDGPIQLKASTTEPASSTGAAADNDAPLFHQSDESTAPLRTAVIDDALAIQAVLSSFSFTQLTPQRTSLESAWSRPVVASDTVIRRLESHIRAQTVELASNEKAPIAELQRGLVALGLPPNRIQEVASMLAALEVGQRQMLASLMDPKCADALVSAFATLQNE